MSARTTEVANLQMVLRLESSRMGAIAEGTLRSVIQRLEAAEEAAPLTWRPLDELPQPVDRHHTALVLCDDGESWWLRSGVVDWNDTEWHWEDEESGEPIEVREGTRYYWCHEQDIIDAAIAQLAKVGAGDTAKAAAS